MNKPIPRSGPSYVGPDFDDAKVHDAMNVGVVTCRRETSLTDAARMMVGYDMHAIVVSDLRDDRRAWGIVTSMDVARAAGEIGSLTAGDVATTDLVTIESNEPLSKAARVMDEHRLHHLIVVQPGTEEPVGVITPGAIAAAVAQSA
jgi:CBS domain-containing protein